MLGTVISCTTQALHVSLDNSREKGVFWYIRELVWFFIDYFLGFGRDIQCIRKQQKKYQRFNWNAAGSLHLAPKMWNVNFQLKLRRCGLKAIFVRKCDGGILNLYFQLANYVCKQNMLSLIDVSTGHSLYFLHVVDQISEYALSSSSYIALELNHQSLIWKFL